MAILKRINRRTRRGVFEISSPNGLISDYALRRARGEGGKPDPKVEAVLARNAQRLKEKQKMAKLKARSPGGGAGRLTRENQYCQANEHQDRPNREYPVGKVSPD